jgi:hypothetical protein
MIALLVGVEGFRAGTVSAAGLQRAAPAILQQRTAVLIMQEDGPSPAPEAADEPEPAYGTEAYFAKDKAKKGILTPEGDPRGGFFQIFGGGEGGSEEPPPAKTIAEVSRAV